MTVSDYLLSACAGSRKRGWRTTSRKREAPAAAESATIRSPDYPRDRDRDRDRVTVTMPVTVAVTMPVTMTVAVS